MEDDDDHMPKGCRGRRRRKEERKKERKKLMFSVRYGTKL
jgi:hypothetical protein